MLLGGHELGFYEYEGDVSTLLDNVRVNLNELAEGWSREQKDHCLQETADAFKVCVYVCARTAKVQRIATSILDLGWPVQQHQLLTHLLAPQYSGVLMRCMTEDN
jgi:hypothetical protein